MEHTGTQTSAFHGDVACQCDSCRKGRKDRIQLRDAAPALLEALQWLLAAYTDSLTDNKGCTCSRCTEAAQVAKSAITKATE